MRIALLLLAFLVSACDSSNPSDELPAPLTGPTGTFSIDPVHFEVDVYVDESRGMFANYQGWIDGDVTLTEVDGVLTGSGTCSWKRRQHRSWLGETNVETGSQRFTVKGTLTGDRVSLDFQGCAWVMVRHTGTFDGTTYRLRIPDRLSGPLFAPDIWDEAVPSRGTDPFGLTLARP